MYSITIITSISQLFEIKYEMSEHECPLNITEEYLLYSKRFWLSVSEVYLFYYFIQINFHYYYYYHYVMIRRVNP
jgi:hypothetical protein